MNNAFQISTTYRLDQLEKKTRSLEESLALLGQKQLSLEKVSDQLVKSKNIKIDIVERPVLEVSKDLLKASKSLLPPLNLSISNQLLNHWILEPVTCGLLTNF